DVDDRGAYTVLQDIERFERRPIILGDVCKRACKALEYRVEPHLRANLEPHRAVRLDLLTHARRPRHTRQLMTRQGGHERDVERVVRRKRTGKHIIRDAPTPAELHGPDVHLVHLRRGNGAVTLLDERTRNTAPAELACES